MVKVLLCITKLNHKRNTCYYGGMIMRHFPRLTTIALSYAAAFLVFWLLGAQFFHDILAPFGIVGVFVGGVFYVFSFTSSIGALILVTVAPYFPVGVIAVVGGFGALAADYTIFNFINSGLKREVERLANSAFICKVGARSVFCQQWFRNVLGTLIIASPLPDELGVAMISTGNMTRGTFALVSFIVDVVGIYVLVYVSRLFY